MKFRILLCLFFTMLLWTSAHSQTRKTQNIIVVTLDGYRWKEVFEGASSKIIFNDRYVKDTTVRELFWDPSKLVRREKLMPFFWNTIGRQGQLYGNVNYKNTVKVTNIHLISYPGYSEMLVGFADPKVTSNKKRENPNYTVLEFIHNQKQFNNEVAAFATWEAFPFILRKEKSKIYVNAGKDVADGKISAIEKKLNEMQVSMPNPHGPRFDEFTFNFAMEYLKRERPRVTFISLEETDEHGHGGRYDEYLKSAHKVDGLLSELWSWVQSQPDYKDQTTLFITTDHGRGSGKNNWRTHSLLAPGSGKIWFAVIGPDTPAFGEMKYKSKYYQKQVAQTLAAFLGIPYNHKRPVGDIIQTMLAVPNLPVDTITAKQYSQSMFIRQN
jgi:hypothetical protein